MTLEELAYIGQIASAVVIVASLAAVYWQVRQTNLIARADLTYSVWLQTGQMQISLYDTPEKAELMHRALRGTGPLSEAEKLRMNVVIGVAIGTHEAGFNLRQRGLIEAGTYSGLEVSTRRYLRSPYVQRWWARGREGKDTQFVALADGMVARIEAEQAANPRSEELRP